MNQNANVELLGRIQILLAEAAKELEEARLAGDNNMLHYWSGRRTALRDILYKS